MRDDFVVIGWDGRVEIISDLSMRAFLRWLEVEGIALEHTREREKPLAPGAKQSRPVVRSQTAVFPDLWWTEAALKAREPCLVLDRLLGAILGKGKTRRADVRMRFIYYLPIGLVVFGVALLATQFWWLWGGVYSHALLVEVGVLGITGVLAMGARGLGRGGTDPHAS